MKAGLIRLMVVGMMVAGVSVAVAQQAPATTPAPATAPKAKDSVKPVTGVLSAPAKDAAAGVLAVLTQKGKDAKTFTLTSDVADVAAKIKDLASKGATVTVNGEMNKEGTSIVVTKIEASKKAEKPAAK